MLLQKYLFNNDIRHSIKLNAKIQKLIKNKKKIVQNRITRILFYVYLTQNVYLTIMNYIFLRIN